MSYKPKYCCQCGGKIERTDWKFWHSRRFCELCETDLRFYDWTPYFAGTGIVLSVLLIGFYFQKPEKPLNITPAQLASSMGNGRGFPANQSSAPSAANAGQTAAQTNVNALPAPPPTALKASETKSGQVAGSPTEASEKIYFCGAATKKGTPCSRRVRGGGRCWQHAGQPAMLAPEKLLASQ